MMCVDAEETTGRPNSREKCCHMHAPKHAVRYGRLSRLDVTGMVQAASVQRHPPPPLWDEMGLPASGKSHESPKFLHTRTSEIAGATSRLFRAMSAWTYIYWELCISFSTRVQT